MASLSLTSLTEAATAVSTPTAPVGNPGPNGQPAPAGWSWVAGATTAAGAWVPGHWERITTTTTTTPAGETTTTTTLPPSSVSTETPTVVDHRGDTAAAGTAVLELGAPTKLWDVAGQGPHLALRAAGLTDEEIAYHDQEVQRALAGQTDDITRYLVAGVRDGVMTFSLTPDGALRARDAGKSPLDWWVAQWAADTQDGRTRKAAADAQAAATKAAADAAKAAAAAPSHPIPPPARPPSSSNTKLLVGVAAIAAGAYLMFGCSGETVKEKVTLRFPFTNNTSNVVVNVGMPGDPERGTNAFLTNLGGGTVSWTQPDPSFIVTPAEIAHPLPLPRRGLAGIAIAADSAIACCDISVDGRTPSRVSVGCPMVVTDAVQRADSLLVTLPYAMPIFSAGLADNRFAADASPVAGALFGGIATEVWGFALRLDLLYCEHDLAAYVGGRRAPYRANARMRLAAGQVGRMLVCVDGRRRVVIDTTAVTAGATIEVKGAIQTKNTLPDVTARLEDLTNERLLTLGGLGASADQSPSALTLNSLSPNRHIVMLDTSEQGDLSVEGLSQADLTPITAITVTITESTGTSTAAHDVAVTAWD